MTSLCPCGSQHDYTECCGPFLTNYNAPTAEALMRSRYTAFVKQDVDYLEKTSAGQAAKDFDRAETISHMPHTEWLGLQIHSTEKGQPDDTEGKVTFTASYRANGQVATFTEASNFLRINGQWHYTSGTLQPTKQPPHTTQKVGRNDSCPCGSNQKFKKCCGK